jgi:hypothetical protein
MVLVRAGSCCVFVVFIVEWVAIKGGTGMAWPEQRICGVAVECGGRMGAGHCAPTVPRVVGCGESRVHADAWLLVVIVTSSEEQSVGAWLAEFLGSLSANGANGLLLPVTH